MLRITLLLPLVALACQAAPSAIEEAADQLYRSVIVGDFEEALVQSKEFVKQKKGAAVTKAVEKLIDENQSNTVNYAYLLWTRDAQDIVKNYFPLEFRSIFSQLSIRLRSKRDGMVLKLGLKYDSDGDKTAFGDTNDLSERAVWKFIPFKASATKVFFKILNVNSDLYLKIGTSSDSAGDRSVYASSNSDHSRHLWYIQPVMYNKQLLFYIYNHENSQALKLSKEVDSDGDRKAFSHNGMVQGSPEIYGWAVTPL